MKGVLVDSNVIIDILTEDKVWYEWSSEQLATLAETNFLHINPIIYAEVSISFKNIEDLELALPSDGFKRSDLPWEAAFLAGKIFCKYRKSGGLRSQPLPDFFIAAHALVKNYILLTRDEKRFKYYFPTLNVISP